MKRKDSYFMLKAINEAYKAYNIKEIPIGAVIVKNGKLLSKGHNMCIKNFDPSAHAEIIALRKAAKKTKNYRLNDCLIYVTVEPCIMCTGALINSRISKIIFGTFNIKSNSCKNLFKITNNIKFNHKMNISYLNNKNIETKCSSIMINFFKNKR
jgi:tRNA(adenine34) deaminase